MFSLRPPNPDDPDRSARFRVLLTEDRARPDEHWTRQVPPMLSPLGVQATIASDGPSALEILSNNPIHAAVVDLNTPAPQDSRAGGLWLLQVIHRLKDPPPVVVVNSHSYSQRQVQRLLNQALDLGAFSVINWPVQIDTLLSTFKRLMERAYDNSWPSDEPRNPQKPQDPDTQ